MFFVVSLLGFGLEVNSRSLSFRNVLCYVVVPERVLHSGGVGLFGTFLGTAFELHLTEAEGDTCRDVAAVDGVAV